MSKERGREGEYTSPLIAMGAVVMEGLGVGRKLFIQKLRLADILRPSWDLQWLSLHVHHLLRLCSSLRTACTKMNTLAALSDMRAI